MTLMHFFSQRRGKGRFWTSSGTALESENRFIPLDTLRGGVMFFLIGEATGIYRLLLAPQLGTGIIHFIGSQFSHHPWNGLRLWDLGQPLFMFISGVAMVFAYNKRWDRGEAWRASLGHALGRSFVLFVLGWAMSHISPMEDGPGNLFLVDVLPQLAFASLITFFLLKKPVRVQAGVALALLVVTELLYRLWPISGFDQPFVPDHNFGSFIDVSIFGSMSEGHWVSFNMIPAAAHTIMGSLAGQYLRDSKRQLKALKKLVLAGFLCAASGLLLSTMTPIIKRICTSSFVLVTGGLCFLALAFSFWLCPDGNSKGPPILCGRRMNPIFIYTFALSGGGDWLRHISEPFVRGIFGWSGELDYPSPGGYCDLVTIMAVVLLAV